MTSCCYNNAQLMILEARVHRSILCTVVSHQCTTFVAFRSPGIEHTWLDTPTCRLRLCRTPYEIVPHGNFFNNLPGAPYKVEQAIPAQDGTISWSKSILDHNKELYKRGHPMVCTPRK
jgi:hypothetical protein